jgi:hypothetical protein
MSAVRTVLTLKKTCLACPSQWEGALDDGRAVYARFRHGHLSVGTGQTVEEAVDNAMSDEALYEGDIGEGFDGFMDLGELKARLQGLLQFPTDLLVENENPPMADRKAIETLIRSRLAGQDHAGPDPGGGSV